MASRWYSFGPAPQCAGWSSGLFPTANRSLTSGRTCWPSPPAFPAPTSDVLSTAGTLDECSNDACIGFGVCFTHRRARVEAGVYVGPYALIGSAILRAGCLIGSRASLLSGGRLHELSEEGLWSPTDYSRLVQIEIGENAWLGEGAIVMANVGGGAMISCWIKLFLYQCQSESWWPVIRPGLCESCFHLGHLLATRT